MSEAWRNQYDRWATGGRPSSYPCRCVCTDCGKEWDDTYQEEYGTGTLETHENCPQCGGDNIDATELDALDIEERKLTARGEDF